MTDLSITLSSSWSRTTCQLPRLTFSGEQEWGCRLRNEASAVQRDRASMAELLSKSRQTSRISTLYFESSRCSPRL